MSRTSILDRLEILSDEYKDVGSWVPKTTLQLCTLGEHKPSPSRVTLPIGFEATLSGFYPDTFADYRFAHKIEF